MRRWFTGRPRLRGHHQQQRVPRDRTRPRSFARAARLPESTAAVGIAPAASAHSFSPVQVVSQVMRRWQWAESGLKLLFAIRICSSRVPRCSDAAPCTDL